jgi:hypothetical protein
MDRILSSLCLKVFVGCCLLTVNQLMGQITPGPEGIVYVNKNVTGGTQSGNSWVNAVPELADVLRWARDQDLAAPNWLSGDSLRVFVAEGTYKPLYNADEDNHGNDGGIDNAFVLINRVYLYGGFPGTGNPNLTNRDFQAHPTILSGDIGQPGDNTDNVCHVVMIVGGDPNRQDKKMDGFVVMGGSATYPQQSPSVKIESVQMQYVRTEAGGIFFSTYGIGSVYPQVLNTTVMENQANYAGGISIRSDYAVLKNVIIKNNIATQWGGGLYNSANGSHALIINTLISDNQAKMGGGIYNFYGASRYHNVTIAGNTASENGNELYFEWETIDDPMIPKTDSAHFTNCVVWHPGSSTVANVFVEGDTTLVVDHSIFPDAQSFVGADNLDLAPDFSNEAAKDFSLKLISPAINKGVNDSVAVHTATDLAGKARLIGSHVDMGAYEQPDGASLPVSIISFDGNYQEGLATVEWRSGVESQFDHYELEVSSEGQVFQKIARKSATGSNSHYKVITPQVGKEAYYRLKLVDKDGSSEYYDKVIMIRSGASTSLSIYPNPANKIIHLQVSQAGLFRIYDASGRLVKQVTLQVGAATVNIQALPKGKYFCMLGDKRFSFVKN